MVSVPFWAREKRRSWGLGSGGVDRVPKRVSEGRTQSTLLDDEQTRTKSFEREISPPPDFVEDAFPKESDGQDDETSSSSKRQSLFSIDNMVTLLQTGTDSQRSVILGKMSPAYEQNRQEVLDVIVPLMCRLVTTWSVELKALTADALLPAGAITYPLDPELAHMITDTALEVIENATEEVIWQAWGDVLRGFFPRMQSSDRDAMRLLKIVDQHMCCSLDASRKLAARLLGLLSKCLDAADVQKYVLDRTLQLSDDSNVDVRGMVTEALQKAGLKIPLEVTETRIWRQLAKLVKDRDTRIQAAALRAVAEIAEHYREAHPNAGFYSRLLPPLFNYHCVVARSRAYEDINRLDAAKMTLMEIFSEAFGRLMVSTHQHWMGDVPRSIYMTVLALSTCNNNTVKRKVAYNLPACALCLRKEFLPDVVKIVRILASSTDPDTRWYVAAGFHELTKLLATVETVDTLYAIFLSLLEDPNEVVRDKVLEQFHVTLHKVVEISPSEDRLVPLYRNMELLGRDGWRTQCSLAYNLEQCAQLFPYAALRNTIVPLLMGLTEEGPFEVRRAAVSAAVNCLRYIPDMVGRDEILGIMRTRWAQTGVHFLRVAFLDASQTALQYFSTLTFRNLFARDVLRLAYDPLSSVRLRLASFLHQLAPACDKMPEFDDAAVRLKQDSDPDVRERMAGIEQRVSKAMRVAAEKIMEDREKQEQEAELFRKFLMGKVSVRSKDNVKAGSIKAIKGASLKVLHAIGSIRQEDILRSSGAIYVPLDKEFLNGELHSCIEREVRDEDDDFVKNLGPWDKRGKKSSSRSIQHVIEDLGSNLKIRSGSERRVPIRNRDRTSERRMSLQSRMSVERNRRISVDAQLPTFGRDMKKELPLRNRPAEGRRHSMESNIVCVPASPGEASPGSSLGQNTRERSALAHGIRSEEALVDFVNVGPNSSRQNIDPPEEISEVGVTEEDLQRLRLQFGPPLVRREPRASIEHSSPFISVDEEKREQEAVAKTRRGNALAAMGRSLSKSFRSLKGKKPKKTGPQNRFDHLFEGEMQMKTVAEEIDAGTPSVGRNNSALGQSFRRRPKNSTAAGATADEPSPSVRGRKLFQRRNSIVLNR